ncbi:MAG TPA: hypothetical protein VGF14_08375 [Alphaproteobacteria bacterium]
MNDAIEQSTPVLPAAQIIDLFGGVRPLAKKLEMAASTVQGWKLRNHIPEQYHARLRGLLPSEAQTLFDQLLNGAALASADAMSSDLPVTEIAIAPAPMVENGYIPPQTKHAAPKPPPRDPNAHYFAMPQAQLRYWVMTSLAMVGIIALVTVVLIVLFFGKDIFDLFTGETVTTTSITRDLESAVNPVIKKDTPAITQNDAATIDKLRRSRDVIDSTLTDVRKIKADTPARQKELVQQINEIETMIGGLRNRIDQMDRQLQAKGFDASAIQEQMTQISHRDVAAAALLLGVAQLHTLLDRQTSFHDDLKFLKMLVSADPEMVKSIDKLAPFAEKGLMTKEQMNETLDMIQQETRQVALSNPDAPWSERLRLAVGNVIQIRKDDATGTAIKTEPHVVTSRNQDIVIPSTPREQVALAQKLLQDDSFMAAARTLQDYQGPYEAEVIELAHNLQGRDAAVNMLDMLIEKSENLLNDKQIKSLLSPPAPTNTSVY